MKTTTLPFIILVLLIAVTQAGAQSYAVALRPSTLGISLEGIRSLSTTFDARVG